MRSTSDPAWRPFAAATFALLVTLAAFWPGLAMYDTVAQYAKVVSGRYDDWHPPMMARLWAGLSPLGGGAGPMLALQLAGYWLGLGLIGGALARTGRASAGLGVVAIGAVPVVLGWQGVVLKDAQMAGAMLAAVGIVAWGMTPIEAIRAATSNAAEALGRDDVGAISAGRWGDMIAVDGDPTVDVRVLEHPVAVIKGGVRER